MNDDGGRVVGSITPDPEGGAPVFTIIRREQHGVGSNARPCEHSSFILDERWSTVTCGKCREKIDPFAALMLYAEWYERFKHRQTMMEQAERRMLVEHLRRLSRRRHINAQEEDEIRTTLGRYWSVPVETLRDLSRRIERQLTERRLQARRHTPRKTFLYAGG